MGRARKLASIQKVLKIEPIPDADRIECISVLGWKLVSEKSRYKPDDMIIYIEIDSIVPNKGEFADVYKYSNGKVRTTKMRGQVSQGYHLSIDTFFSMIQQGLTAEQKDTFKQDNPNIVIEESSNGFSFPIIEGIDVTALLGITKYEKPIPVDMKDIILNNLPSYIFKTDEPRIQANPKLLLKYQDLPFYATEKVDGESSTFYWNNGHFGVGSRVVEFKDHPKVTQWRVAHDLGLPEKMAQLNRNIAIQGELLGEGVQGNKYKLKGHRVMFFTAFDIDKAKYFNWSEMNALLNELNLSNHIVPLINNNYHLPNTVEELEKYVETENEGKSRVNLETKREGIVFRALKELEDVDIGRLSFKSVSKKFLIKYNE